MGTRPRQAAAFLASTLKSATLGLKIWTRSSLEENYVHFICFSRLLGSGRCASREGGVARPCGSAVTHARSIRVIFEKQREKCVKPIMRRRDATHSVRSQWTDRRSAESARDRIPPPLSIFISGLGSTRSTSNKLCAPPPPILELDLLCVRAKGRLVFTCVVFLKTLSCKK